MLTLTSSTLSPVVTGFGGLVGDQQITGNGSLSDQLTITRNTPAAEGTGTRTDLLTMTFTAQLLGALGSSPQLSGDTSLSYTVNFASDFLTFPNGEHDFSMTFSSWDSGLQLSNQHLGDSTSQYYQAAAAAGAGTFAANTVAIPEPSTLVLGFVGALSLLIGWARTMLVRRKNPA